MRQSIKSLTYQFHKKIKMLKEMGISLTGTQYYRMSQAKDRIELDNLVHYIIINKEYIKEV